jgi:hypothetical protein
MRMPIDPPDTKPAPRWASQLVSAANSRNRARWPHLDHALFRIEDLMEVWKACGGTCAVSGLPFNLTIVGTGQAKRPFAPSLDRKNRDLPYRQDNVRLVLAIANFAMNAWGLRPLIELSNAVATKHGQGGRAMQTEQGPADANLDMEATLDAEFVETDKGLLAFPPRMDMHVPILRFLEDSPKTSRKIEIYLAEEFNISEHDQKIGNRNYPAWRYYVSFSLVDLVKHKGGKGGTGEVQRIGTKKIDGGTTGIYRITDLGRTRLRALTEIR